MSGLDSAPSKERSDAREDPGLERCSVCNHRRNEHYRDGVACDVRECACSGFVELGGGVSEEEQT